MTQKKRGYHQFCGIARALDLVGERWTLLIVRDLLLGPKRFKDILADLPGLTTNLLSKRLKEMEEHGLLEKIILPAPAKVPAYNLTESGRALRPTLMALGAWGWRTMTKPREGEKVDIGWALLSLTRRYRGSETTWTLEIHAQGKVFQMSAAGDHIDVRQGGAKLPDLTLHLEPAHFRALFLENQTLESQVSQGLKVHPSLTPKTTSLWQNIIASLTPTAETGC